MERHLDIRDWAAQKAAYRTGKVDELGGWASVVTITPKQVDSILQSNPETEQFVRWPEGWGIGMRMDDPDKPWADIRVRRALQKAIPTEEIANDYYGGYTEPALYPIFGSLVKGFFTPYEEWPDEITGELRLTIVEAAKALMAEAGYPDGFDVTPLARHRRAGPRAGPDREGLPLRNQRQRHHRGDGVGRVLEPPE